MASVPCRSSTAGVLLCLIGLRTPTRLLRRLTLAARREARSLVRPRIRNVVRCRSDSKLLPVSIEIPRWTRLSRPPRLLRSVALANLGRSCEPSRRVGLGRVRVGNAI